MQVAASGCAPRVPSLYSAAEAEPVEHDATLAYRTRTLVRLGDGGNAAQELRARLELITRHELVGAVGVVDRAGPADHRGDAGALEQPRLGRERHRAGTILPGQP